MCLLNGSLKLHLRVSDMVLSVMVDVLHLALSVRHPEMKKRREKDVIKATGSITSVMVYQTYTLQTVLLFFLFLGGFVSCCCWFFLTDCVAVMWFDSCSECMCDLFSDISPHLKRENCALWGFEFLHLSYLKLFIGSWLWRYSNDTSKNRISHQKWRLYSKLNPTIWKCSYLD